MAFTTTRGVSVPDQARLSGKHRHIAEAEVKKRLSTAALETVSIIAYKQPVTKGEIEQIRGVNCDYAIQKLLEKELIVIRGKADSVGRLLLYGTSNKFMEYTESPPSETCPSCAILPPQKTK